MPPLVLFDSFGGSFPASWRFAGYRTTLTAQTAAEVEPVIAAAEAATAAGQYAVGFVAYEAAGALNPELPLLAPQPGLPLAWFALFDKRLIVAPGDGLPAAAERPVPLLPPLPTDTYQQNVERIRALIAAGDSYQVNYTFPLSGRFEGDPRVLYASVCRAQQPQFAALLDIGSHAVISASPELFFAVRDGRIVTQPMKGTARRGRWPAEDRQLAAALQASAKERAENLMIVDLLRNDVGKIAATGSVTVDELFAVERYPTVHQMTSTVSARLRPDVGLLEVLRALFPCGSVTGAPKRRSMAIIAAAEGTPRGVYCGAIGCLAPGGEAIFSVAIRTLLLDKGTGAVSLGVGSGITFDSEPLAEYAESIGKAAFVTGSGEEFHLFETLRLNRDGCQRIEHHLARLAASARCFDFPFDREEAVRLLTGLAAAGAAPLRVRLALFASGRLAVRAESIVPEVEPLTVGIADVRTDPHDPLLPHKTSDCCWRDAARSRRPDCGELLFFNNRGELTEGSYNTVVLNIGGRLLTPPLKSGLLPGILRQELLENGTIEERLLDAADLRAAEEIWLINSLRGRRRAVLVEGDMQCDTW